MATLPAVVIRHLSMYSVQYKRKITDYKNKTGQQLLLDLINAESSVVLDFTTLSFGTPQPNVGPGLPRNTKLVVTALANDSFGGSKEVKYDRIPMSRPFATPLTLGFTVTNATTVHALLDAINTAHNVKLVPGDVVDNPVVANAKTVRLVAASTSYLYHPGTVVSLGAVEPTIDSVVTVKSLNGFDRVAA